MINKDLILDILNKPFCHDISIILKRSKLNRSVLLKVLDELIRDNIVYKKNSSYYIMKKGKFVKKNDDFGFISVEGEDEDYFVSSFNMKNAYTDDIVSFYILPKEVKTKKNEGVIINVLERGMRQIFGVVVSKKNKKGTKYFIRSRDKKVDVKAIVLEENLGSSIPDDIVVGDIYFEKNEIYAKVTKVIGNKSDPGVDISLIALQYGFNLEFNDDVIDELNTIPSSIDISNYKSRADFTSDLVITIDGVDSKDFDDAVSLKILSNGNYKLFVHIADVSEYVKASSPLDKEAYKRGTSLYLADRVIPMLPHKLSNGICSLNEGEYRLVLSCIMEIDKYGNLVSYDICEGIIKSIHRMTYDDVNKILVNNDKDLINRYNDIYPMLKNMLELSNIIRTKREKKGALDFDVPEYKAILDEYGNPIDFKLRTRDKAELLIEDFMLMANETVAYHMNISSIPFVYRVHENPDEDKLLNVFNVIKKMGKNISNIKNDIKPKMIQSIMNSFKDTNEYYIVNNMILRAMMKARYSELNLGHYGLAFDYYCHFTSPIRRYPDLMVHRLIKKLILHPTSRFNDDIIYYQSHLNEISLNCSVLERKSIECEREVDDFLKTIYMSNFIGSHFEGIITSIVPYGMYVELNNSIEGLVHISTLNGYYNYDEVNMRLSSMNKTYSIGDKVMVSVYNTSKIDRTIDFIIPNDYSNGWW